MLAYNNFCPTTICGWRESTLVTMSAQSTEVATVLCRIAYINYAVIVTNYEISLWQYHFLQLWSQHPVKPYLTVKDFFSLLNIPYVEIFQKFGGICIYLTYYITIDDKITPDNIISIIWLFVFLNIDSLIRSIIVNHI